MTDTTGPQFTTREPTPDDLQRQSNRDRKLWRTAIALGPRTAMLLDLAAVALVATGHPDIGMAFRLGGAALRVVTMSSATVSPR